MKEQLEVYGEVLQCEELDGMFHVHVGKGFKIGMVNTYKCANVVLDVVGEKFPIIHKLNTDNDNFHLILKSKK